MHKLFLFISLLFIIDKSIVNGENSNETFNGGVISCDKLSDKEACIRMPLKPFRGEYVIANDYKINTCIMGKTFSSMQLGIFCYLYDEKNFIKKFKNRKDKAADRHICKNSNRYHQMSEVIKKFSDDNDTQYFSTWNNLLVVREPISRFISGFVQLCVLNIGLPLNHPYCFGCGKNMHCFLTNLYNDIRKVVDGKKKPVYFIKYHFYPQTWQCQYNLYKDQYVIIQYEAVEKKKFYGKYLEKLENSDVPKEKLEFIKRILFTSKISHSTYDKVETKKYKKAIYKNQRLLTLISKIFYDDYLEFGFPLPLIKN
uniref:Sulfotransferase family-containing protein n=1 Tax=Strongyloides venezuelensis TaxID=75913 RepID=A0A0K0FPT5_STRVS